MRSIRRINNSNEDRISYHKFQGLFNNSRDVKIEESSTSRKSIQSTGITIDSTKNPDERVFLDFIKSVIQSDKELERLKSELSLKPDFRIDSLFNSFKGHEDNISLSLGDFRFSISKYLNIFPTSRETFLLFNRYSSESDKMK